MLRGRRYRKGKKKKREKKNNHRAYLNADEGCCDDFNLKDQTKVRRHLELGARLKPRHSHYTARSIPTTKLTININKHLGGHLLLWIETSHSITHIHNAVANWEWVILSTGQCLEANPSLPYGIGFAAPIEFCDDFVVCLFEGHREGIRGVRSTSEWRQITGAIHNAGTGLSFFTRILWLIKTFVLVQYEVPRSCLSSCCLCLGRPNARR